MRGTIPRAALVAIGLGLLSAARQMDWESREAAGSPGPARPSSSAVRAGDHSPPALVPAVVPDDEGASSPLRSTLPKRQRDAASRKGSALSVPSMRGEPPRAVRSRQARTLPGDVPISATLAGGESGARALALRAVGGDGMAESGLDGRGIGVAVVDSGIADHPALSGQVVLSADFTREPPLISPGPGRDGFGHGTHVAGILAAAAGFGVGAGIASGVDLIDVRVIDDEGKGRTSRLIRALDWIAAQGGRYGIRVVNLSLGHAPLEPCRKDPLCSAVGRLVDRGIVVVASAGNLGRSAEHDRVWGGINSPASHPRVIAVAPLDTAATASHQDDSATAFGSRGPACFEGHFKPDLAAPGRRIASLPAPGSTLAERFSQNSIEGGGLILSGSSMAVPFVSGTAAIMLQAAPQLSPDQVRRILCLTAVKLKRPHMLEQGNGLLNARKAVEVALAADGSSRWMTRPVAPHWRLGSEIVLAGGAWAEGFHVALTAPVASNSPKWGDGADWISDPLTDRWGSWAQAALGRTRKDRVDSGRGPSSARLDGLVWKSGISWIQRQLGPDSVIWTDGVMRSESWPGTDW